MTYQTLAIVTLPALVAIGVADLALTSSYRAELRDQRDRPAALVIEQPDTPPLPDIELEPTPF